MQQLQQDNEDLIKQERDLQNNQIYQERQIEQSKDEIDKYRRELDQLKSEKLSLLKLIDDLQARQQSNLKKEENNKKLLLEYKEKM